MAGISKPIMAAAFIGRYKRYKAGTKQVIEWLARAVDRIDDLSSCLDCLRPEVGGKTLSSTDIETVRIKTYELEKLAQIIADSDPPVGVPQDILRVLEDVIAGRQACAGWYASQAIDNMTELAGQNASHAHFIAVLRNVQTILCKSNGADPSPSGSMTHNEADAPSNIFSVLDLDETPGGGSESDGSPVRLQAQKNQKPKKKSKALARLQT